jgi:peptidoglycan/LPS O-acetylase OafA/YrhL
LKRYGKPLFFMGVAALFAGSYFGWHIETNSYLTNSLGYSAVAFMSAGLLIWATIGKGWLYRLLVIRPLRFIGTISYTAYVIHVPMIQLLQDWGALHGDRHGARLAAASVPLTLLFASVSWYAIERPILRWNHRTRKPDAGISLAAEQPGSSS